MTDAEKIVPVEGNNNEPTKSTEPQATPSAAPAMPGSPVQPVPGTQNDFKKILEEVKLPERREFKAAADIQKPAPEPEAAILEEHIVKRADGAPGDTSQTQGEPSQTEPANERSSSIVVPVRTLKDDLQNVVREQKISLVHAATLEEEKKHGQEHLTPEQQEIKTRTTRRTVGILFAAAVLIMLGIAAIFGVMFVAEQQQSTPSAPQSSILFAEQTLSFSLDNQPSSNLKSALAQARTKQLGSLGSITRIVPTVQATSTSGTPQATPATIAQFFASLGMKPPQTLVGAIGPNFFLGFHVVDTNAPIMVIPVTSYDHAFAGMLAWEPTMDSDLSPIFNAVSMTTTATSGLPVQRTFQDAVMRNYDVRELIDDSGNVVLYYSFPTPNILVIAQSPYSFTEILSRLQAGREL